MRRLRANSSSGFHLNILYPHIPKILKKFSDAFPRVEVKLISTRTVELKEEFAKGRLDLTLTNESENAKGW